MAKRAVEVRACDRCGKEPANTWLITGPGGAPREIDLCEQHGFPVANAYALARPLPKRQPSAKHGRTAPRSQPDTVVPEPLWR
jgi:hypothetical protein